jgi:hypothetical protein
MEGWGGGYLVGVSKNDGRYVEVHRRKQRLEGGDERKGGEHTKQRVVTKQGGQRPSGGKEASV